LARYEHLPIFADAYRLALQVELLVGAFAARHRAGLGADLRQQYRSILRLIIAANNERDRGPTLVALRLAVEEFLVLCRIAKDVRAFPNLKAYETCATLAHSVSRQTEAWLRSRRVARPDAGSDASS
jgi:hypothetical protein